MEKWGDTQISTVDPDIHYSFAQIVQENGFDYEQHTVTTSDDYELTVMRVTSPEMKSGAPVVFLQHGLFSSAETWIMDRAESVAFQLAKQGFDVWLGNNRGCYYSRRNRHLSPDKDRAQFFDYSFFELGKYDAPAQIDFVRERTGSDKISYVGHSQGTSQMFAALSENFGDLQSKLNYFAALAPIVNLKNSPNAFLQFFSDQWWFIKPQAEFLGIYEFRDPKVDSALRGFCAMFASVCDALENWLNIGDSPYDDKERGDVLNARPGSSASLKQLIHYGQNMRSGEYKQYDYGSDAENIAHYGSKIVPVIVLESIKHVPISMFVGKEDDLGDPTDNRHVRTRLSTLKSYREYDGVDHYSYLIGKDMSFV